MLEQNLLYYFFQTTTALRRFYWTLGADLGDCIFFVNETHCRQNLCLTIVIRRFCSRLVKLYQNQGLKLAVITYRKCRQADLRRLVLS